MSESKPSGYSTSSKFTVGELNGIRAKRATAGGCTGQDIGFILAVKEGDGMVVTIDVGGLSVGKVPPVISTEMMDAAEMRDGYLCFD